jgi:coenzyme F420-reducing hydrogenase beta subunit
MIICDKKVCCGCFTCLNICPQKAIKIFTDNEGFRYPYIDEKLCINCSLCRDKCPSLNNNFNKLKNDEPIVYAVKHRNDNVRINSSSGGMFTALSDYILSINGVIYCAKYGENFEVIHKRINTKTERDTCLGSKYLQSNLKKTFKSIKRDLLNEIPILFVGTPCQIAGLKLYLGKLTDSENLFLCDLICHGVPSYKIFNEHIKKLSKHKIVKDYYFRSKINGWKTHTESVLYQDNSFDNKTRLSQSYKYLFSKNLILRPSCYNCPYTTIKRVSDITIGDYWGINKVMAEFDDNKGVSLALVNTFKGEKLFEACKKDLIYKISNVEDCKQPQLMYPTKMPKNRDAFFEDYENKGYDYILKKYSPVGINIYLKEIILNILRKIGLRKILKKLIKLNIF